MLKSLSAALIAVSVLAAPAMAGSFGHPNRGAHSHAYDANAKMIHRHHDHHRRLHQHRDLRPHFHLHNKFGLHKTFRHSGQSAKTVHNHG